MNKQQYRMKQAEEMGRVLKGVSENPNHDPDVLNLRLILLSIAPYSRWWRLGCVRSLKRAIKVLERENERGQRLKDQYVCEVTEEETDMIAFRCLKCGKMNAYPSRKCDGNTCFYCGGQLAPIGYSKRTVKNHDSK